MNTQLSEYRVKQTSVEHHIQEIDRLNVVINSIEKQMVALRSTYDRAVEERNSTGSQLIDRNDELCRLYEVSNELQQSIGEGELRMKQRNEDHRLLRLKTEELKRQHTVARSRVPEIDLNKCKIEILEAQLVAERKKTEACCRLLEDPHNADRWRLLDGEDPSPDQLASKISMLESRLDGKREELLSKELILDEITALIDQLRSQALSRKASAKAQIDRLSDYQGRIRETTKQMLASVSELSMYQVHTHVHCTVLYCTVLYCTVLYCTVLYCTVLYCTVLYCTVLHLNRFILSFLFISLYVTLLFSIL